MSNQSGLGATVDEELHDSQPIKWFIVQTWETVKGNFWTLLGLYFLPTLLFFVLGFGIFAFNTETDVSGELVFKDETSVIALIISLTTLAFLIYMFIFFRIIGGLVPRVIDYVNKRTKFSMAEVWTAGKGKAWAVAKTIFFVAWPIIAIYAISAAATVSLILGFEESDDLSGQLEELAPLFVIGVMTFVAVLIASYFIFMRWAVAIQSVVVENLGVAQGKQRSEELMNESKPVMRNLFWAIFGISIIGSLLGNIPLIGIIPTLILAVAGMAAPGVIYVLAVKRAPNLKKGKSKVGLDAKA